MGDSFLFYRSFDEVISQIPESEMQLKFYKALIDFGLNDVKTEFPYPLNLLYTQMCASISSAKTKHEKRVEAGRKGGQAGKGTSRNHGNGNAKTKANNSKTKANDNVNDNVNVNDNDNVNLHYSAVGSRLNAEPPSPKLVKEINEETGEVKYVYANERFDK